MEGDDGGLGSIPGGDNIEGGGFGGGFHDDPGFVDVIGAAPIGVGEKVGAGAFEDVDGLKTFLFLILVGNFDEKSMHMYFLDYILMGSSIALRTWCGYY